MFDLLGRLAELPYRLGPKHCIAKERHNTTVVWPRKLEWAPSGGIVSTLRDALERACVLYEGDIPQPYSGVILLRVNGHSVVLDYFDHPEKICLQALKDAALYIKLMYRSGGYQDARIVAGGYLATAIDFYRYYLPFRHLGNQSRNIVGRFGLTFQREFRTKAVEILQSDPALGFTGPDKVRYSRFLREVADSKMALHMPGNGPFTHRVAEFLGLGTCMVSVRFTTELHVPLIPDTHYVCVADDLSDLKDKVRYYLAHDHERDQIARAGRQYFDEHLHADHLASHYLKLFAAMAPAEIGTALDFHPALRMSL